MKIKTNFTEEREIEIELPLFRKEKRTYDTAGHNYFAVLPDETTIDIYISDDLIIVRHWTAEKSASDIAKRKDTWDEVSEEEFLSAHQGVLASLSLVPQLSVTEKEIEKEMKDYDDLKEINI